MPDMKSMKMTADEKENYGPTAVAPEEMKYPYGLCIELSDESLEKLNLSSLPSVGDKMFVMAKVEVKSVSMNDYAGGGKHRCVGLQITDMALEKESAAKSLYGE